MTPTTALQALKQLLAVTDSDKISHEEVLRMANDGDAFWAAIRDARAALSAPAQDAPIDMVLHCPACGRQHIDAREYQHGDHTAQNEHAAWEWNNPPHRSHLCHGCGHIWRPADVPTNGVTAVKTKGKADSPIISRAASVAPAQDAQAGLIGDCVASECAARTQPATPAEQEDPLACAEAVLDDYAASIPLAQTEFDCIGDYITAVVGAIRAPAADWLAWVAEDGYRTDAERSAATLLLPLVRTAPAQGAAATFTRLVSACQLAASTVYEHAPSDTRDQFERALSDAERALLADHFVGVNKMVMPAVDAAATVPLGELATEWIAGRAETYASVYPYSTLAEAYQAGAEFSLRSRILQATATPPAPQAVPLTDAAELLQALKKAHEAIDVLAAMVITLDKSFRPTESPIWPSMVAVNAAIVKAEAAGIGTTATKEQSNG